MKKTILPIFLTISLFSHSQQRKSLNDSLFVQAADFKRNNNKAKAIEALEKISKYSKQSNTAFMEKARTMYSEDKKEEVLKMLEDKDIKDFEPQDLNDYYVLLGNVYDLNGREEESLQTYNKALKLFPDSYLLLFNRGVTYINLKKNEEALADFQHSISIYPNFPKSHFFAGAIALENGNLAEGTLAITTAILLDENGTITTNGIRTLNEQLSEKFEEPENKFNLEGSEAFASIENVMRKQYALSKDYKLSSEMDFPIVRQLQALLSELSKISNRDGFYAKTYADFYTKIWQSNQFENFSYALFTEFDNEQIQKTVAKKSSNIKKFQEWGKPELISQILATTKNGKRVNVIAEGEYIGYGTLANLKKTGNWSYNYNYGNKAFDINFLNGNYDGLAKGFYPDGTPMYEINYKNGNLDGKATYYYKNGNVQSKKEFLNGVQTNVQETFYLLGGTKCYTPVKNDSKDGIETCYYQNGTKETVINFVKNSAEGKSDMLFPDGSVKSSQTFLKDYFNGERKTFFPNKNPETLEFYKNKTQSGDIISYFPNGKQNTVMKVDNNIFSSVKKYLGDQIAEDYIYTSGKLTKSVNYVLGKPRIEFSYSGAANEEYITSYKVYDENGTPGKEISISTEVPFVIKNGDGNPVFSGKYNKKGQKEGEWKIYNLITGVYENHAFYKNGIQVDKFEEFFPSGSLKTSIIVDNDKKNGPYISYFENGSKNYQTNYVNDIENGEVQGFFKNGKIKTGYFLNNGKPNGIMENYDVNGNLLQRSEFTDGEVEKDTFFFNGKQTNAIDYKKNGSIEFFQKTPEETFIATLKNGIFEGEYSTHNSRKKTSFTTKLINGKKYGLSKYYNPNGTLSIEYNNLLNESDGEYISNNLDGKIFSKSSYYNGLTFGPYLKYLPTGHNYLVTEYFNDVKHGTEKFLGTNGEVLLTINYHNNIPVNYQTQEQSQPISIKNGNADITAKYKNGKTGIELHFNKGLSDGSSYFFAENGTLLMKSTLKNGYFEGERHYYFNDGKLSSTDSFKDGDYHGKRKLYYPDGKLKIEADYYLDQLHGEYKEYSTDGKLIISQKYVMDALVENIL